jgi:hypothetical protein
MGPVGSNIPLIESNQGSLGVKEPRGAKNNPLYCYAISAFFCG